MIVIDIVPHMKIHTAVANDAATGRNIGEKIAACTETGHDEPLSWARGLGAVRSHAADW